MGSGKCLPINDPNSQWNYCPSFGGAIAYTSLFCFLTLAHVTQAIMYRKAFCWVIIMAVGWEAAGFIVRIMGVEDQTSATFVSTSQILILLAPLWINAFAYMILGRMTYYWLPGKRVWKIRARTMTKYFVWADVFSFFIQAGGGSLIGEDDAKIANIGLKIYMVGIGIQQAFLIAFFALCVCFHAEVQKSSVPRQSSWRPLLYTMYLALAMITVRIIFRLVEFSSGVLGPIPTHEAYFYVLEATPMIIASTGFAIVHPGRFLIGEDSEFSKMKIVEGKRRWWCCGLRKKTKIDLDFELPDNSGNSSLNANTEYK